MLIQNYDLDMVPGGIPLTVHVSQYDTDVQLVFKLFASRGTLNLYSGASQFFFPGTVYQVFSLVLFTRLD